MVKKQIALYGYRCFIASIKTDDIYKDIVEDVETRFDTSNYEFDLCLKEKIKKVIKLMTGKLGGKIMTKFFRLKTQTFSYLVADASAEKKAKGPKSVS